MFEDSSDDDETLAAYAIQPLSDSFSIDPFSADTYKQQPQPIEQCKATSTSAADKRVTVFPVDQTSQLIDVSLASTSLH